VTNMANPNVDRAARPMPKKKAAKKKAAKKKR
jgi:hypothetical protein